MYEPAKIKANEPANGADQSKLFPKCIIFQPFRNLYATFPSAFPIDKPTPEKIVLERKNTFEFRENYCL